MAALDFQSLGYVMVALFVIGRVGSLLLWKCHRIEDLEYGVPRSGAILLELLLITPQHIEEIASARANTS